WLRRYLAGTSNAKPRGTRRLAGEPCVGSAQGRRGKMARTQEIEHADEPHELASRPFGRGSNGASRGCIRKRHVTMPSEVVARLRRPASNSTRSTGSRRALLAIIYRHDIASKRPRNDSLHFGCSSLMYLRYGTHCSAPLYRAALHRRDEGAM